MVCDRLDSMKISMTSVPFMRPSLSVSVFLNSSSYRSLSATDMTQFTAGWNQQKVDMYSGDILVSVIYHNGYKKDVIAIDAGGECLDL